MGGKNIINIKINIEQGNICFTKDQNPFSPKTPIETGDGDSDVYNIRVELGIAKVFHKVLNLIKADKELFQKEDFELLGDMLSKILFGKSRDDVRNYIMAEVEQSLDIETPDGNKICRIFLEFDQKSGVAMLPWEYTRYKLRTNKEGLRPLYISADKKCRFQLMRRVNHIQYENPDAEKLFFIVLLNTDGNAEANPPIDARSGEDKKVKAMFQQLQEAFPDKLIVEYIDAETISNIRETIEKLYRGWKKQYGMEPCYVLHYLGHAMMESQLGMLVIKNENTEKAGWMDDKTFASNFAELLDVSPPTLVCFQACDSAKLGSFNDTLRGVAYEFTKLNTPAVVGMQNEIDTPTSCAFYKKFYEGLLKGKDVAEAVTIGRDHLGREYNTGGVAYKNNWFGSPVLFITTEEPIRLVKPEEPQQLFPEEQPRQQVKHTISRTFADARVDKVLMEAEKPEEKRNGVHRSSSPSAELRDAVSDLPPV